MKRDAIDFHLVPDDQSLMHDRLTNWARWVAVKFPEWQAPIWRLGKSNGRQWHEPELSLPVDSQDGHKLEKAVSSLPVLHRDALRWHYCWRTPPAHARRVLGVTNEGLMQLVKDARLMLRNRRV